MKENITIGFIGLGHMGFPMASNLIKHGYRVVAFDLQKTAVEKLAEHGAIAANNISDAAKTADIVITMLQTGNQVKQSCLGDNGIFSHLSKNKGLFIDSSSIDIHTARELHDIAKKQHISMIDAPVSGGVAAAAAGALTFMLGGEKENVDRAMPILSAMGKKIIHAGIDGCGAAAKICNNMLLGISMIGVCESFLLAEQLGLDPKKLFEISSNASGQCWSLTQYCPWPNILPNVPSSHDYQPGFSAKMMLKDLRLSQDAAEKSHATTPLGKHATALYEKFVAENTEEIDFSGIIQMLEKK